VVIAIVGGSGGIGAALLRALAQCDDVSQLHATYNTSPPQISPESTGRVVDQLIDVRWTALDATDEHAVAQWLEDTGPIDWLINCVGILHTPAYRPEKSIREFDPVYFQHCVQINCLPTLLLGKYAREHLKASAASVFATISARVGSIEDNKLGGWYSYRASKAALNMSLKCLAIEWERTLPNARVIALHPGTTNTALSAPFQKRISASQLFSTEQTATYLLTHLRAAQQHPSGRFIAWDGRSVPW